MRLGRACLVYALGWSQDSLCRELLFAASPAALCMCGHASCGGDQRLGARPSRAARSGDRPLHYDWALGEREKGTWRDRELPETCRAC